MSVTSIGLPGAEVAVIALTRFVLHCNASTTEPSACFTAQKPYLLCRL